MLRTGSAAFRVAGCVALLYLAPVLYAVARSGQDALYNLLAPDAYYYFTIARNTPRGAFASFDGLAPTNGFHPLWQYLLIGLWRLAGSDRNAFLWSMFVCNASVAAAAICVLAHTVYQRQRSLWLALLLVPGIFQLLVPRHGVYSLSTWRVLNGMETSLSLLFLALIVARLAALQSRPDAERWTGSDRRVIGSCTAMAVLSRLDNLALLVAHPLYLLPGGSRGQRALWLLGVPLLGFAAYLAMNLGAGLPALPVSSTTKTSFVLVPQLRAILDTVLSPIGLGLGAPVPELGRVRSRMLAVLIAGCLLALAIAAVSYLRTSSRDPRERAFPAVFAPLVLFLLARLAYYVTFIKLSHQGYWYYSDIAAALAAILLLQVDLRARMSRATWKIAAACVWALFYVGSARSFLDFSAENKGCAHFLAAEAETITRCLRTEFEAPKLLDSSDALFSFFLDLPSQPGTGLTATAAGDRWISEHGLGAYHRALVRDGYVIQTVSRRCYSGDVGARLKAEPIDCGQDPILELFRLKAAR